MRAEVLFDEVWVMPRTRRKEASAKQRIYYMIIKKDIFLKEFTTFKIGGKANFFCVVTNQEELIEAIGFAKRNKMPFFILGGGSNILVSDKGFQGLVIKMELKGIEYEEEKVTAYAGVNWDYLVNDTVERGLYGLENLSGIPGTTGAAPIQNIGAYGSEIKDALESVYVLDTLEDQYKTFINRECKFTYRDSIFKKEPRRYVVISVTLLLKKDGKLNLEYKDLKEYFKDKNPSLVQVRNAVIEIRKGKFPDLSQIGTAGSFFKNIITSYAKAKELGEKYPKIITYSINNKFVKVPTAWILDHVCEFKGVKRGNVGVYKNQALVLVNYGSGTADEITDLAQEMVDCVYEKTGIEIEPEVEYVI